MLDKAKITKVTFKDNAKQKGYYIDCENQIYKGNNKFQDILLLQQYGINCKPKIGDTVVLMSFESGQRLEIDQRKVAIYYNPTLEFDQDNEYDVSIGNFKEESYITFKGKDIETTDKVENIKIIPTTRLTVETDEVEIKANKIDLGDAQSLLLANDGTYQIPANTFVVEVSGGGGAPAIGIKNPAPVDIDIVDTGQSKVKA